MIITKSPATTADPPSNNSQRRARIKQQIIKKFYKEGQLSIHDICHSVKLSAPTVAKTIDELIEQQLVIKIGVGGSSGGRRPGIYALNPSSRYVFAIDLERSFIRMAIFDFTNKPASRVYQFNEGLDTLPDVFHFINEKINEILKNNKISKKKVIGIGLSLPGLIDRNTGLSYTYLKDINPAITLTELTGVKTFVEHDTKVMALGEQAFGAAKGLNNVLCLNMGSGIGLSMILNGTIFRGHSGYSGEFGHIQLDNNGALCHCGKTGCIETMAAGKSIIAKALKQISEGRNSSLQSFKEIGTEKLTTSAIINAAREGDFLSSELINQAGEALGKGIAVLVHLFNPELIILGGELSKASDMLLKAIERNLDSHTIDRIRKDAQIVVSELGEDARIMGTLALVMSKAFA
ncbi:MAG TPA: ROK family protein [Lentimicrobium sp.]|nr:ROK family protein [Lentimicrobium sp.]